MATDNKKNETLKNSQADDLPVSIAPDGGWGWIVCSCSFMICLLLDGLCFSYGLMFTEFLDFYKESKGKTSWAGSVMNGTYMVMAPLAGAMVNKFGCRKVALFGATMASISLFVSMFSPTVDVLIFTYGFLVGTGFGFLYLPANVIVGHYFDKKRALATGIAVCGSGIGGFVFAPLVELLLYEYHMKGTIMILSAIILNAAVFACFYRPLQVKAVKEQPNLMDTCEANNDKTQPHFHNGNANIYKSPKESFKEMNGRVKTVSNGHASIGGENTDHRDIVRLAMSQDMAVLMKKKNCCEQTVHKHLRHEKDKHICETECLRLSRSHDILPLLRSRESAGKENRKHLNPLMRKDVFFSGSIQNLPAYKEMGYEKFVEQMMDTTHKSNGDLDAGSVQRKDRNIFLRALDDFTSFMDFSLLTSVTFDIYGLSCFLCMLGFFIPFTYLPDMCKDFGISLTQSALLISIIGITNTVGRILVGFLSDRPWADCLLINNVALTLCGIAVVVMPFYVNYAVLVVYCIIFGMGIGSRMNEAGVPRENHRLVMSTCQFLNVITLRCIAQAGLWRLRTCVQYVSAHIVIACPHEAAFVSLRSIIMVDLMGIEKLTNSFGLVVLCQGLSSYIGSPIAGSISDWTGSYHASFYLSGITLTTAGLICFPLRRIARWENNRKEHKKSVADVTANGRENVKLIQSKC